MIKKVLILFLFIFFITPCFAYDKVIKKNGYMPDQKILFLYNNPVIYNTKTHKYHKPGCNHAANCTANCVYMEKEQARQKGVPCKVCGG